MYPLVERYLESGSTQKVFCARHGLSVFVLNYWLKKYRQENPAGFIEMPLPLEASAEAFAEVLFMDGTRLRFMSVVSPDYLERLLR
jgi:transposase-like protein